MLPLAFNHIFLMNFFKLEQIILITFIEDATNHFFVLTYLFLLIY